MKPDVNISKAMELMEAQAQDWGQPLRVKQLDLLQKYAEVLSTYTEANVIGSKGIPNIILDHVLDSLSCLSLQEVEIRGKLVDVGAGGGLPSIPLAITVPELKVTLLEATRKKVRFLQYAEDILRLSNSEVLNTRAEDAGTNGQLRDRYNLAVARALASLPVVLEYCAPFVKKGGAILAMKGRLNEDELLAGRRAATKLGAELYRAARVHYRPELEQKQRHIVIFRKTAPTPTGYPRRIGLAKKRPLGS